MQRVHTLHCPDARARSRWPCAHRRCSAPGYYWNPQWAMQQTSRAPLGMPRPPRVERSVLERSAVVITYRFACSGCHQQLRRGPRRT